MDMKRLNEHLKGLKVKAIWRGHDEIRIEFEDPEAIAETGLVLEIQGKYSRQQFLELKRKVVTYEKVLD